MPLNHFTISRPRDLKREVRGITISCAFIGHEYEVAYLDEDGATWQFVMRCNRYNGPACFGSICEWVANGNSLEDVFDVRWNGRKWITITYDMIETREALEASLGL